MSFISFAAPTKLLSLSVNISAGVPLWLQNFQKVATNSWVSIDGHTSKCMALVTMHITTHMYALYNTGFFVEPSLRVSGPAKSIPVLEKGGAIEVLAVGNQPNLCCSGTALAC